MKECLNLKMNRKKGFSLLEIVIAMAFMSIAILAMMWLNSASTRGSMDAYYEFMAFSLAREPIEIFRGFGYETLYEIYNDNSLAPTTYPVNRYINMADIMNPMAQIQYPVDAEMFQRRIDLTHVEHNGMNGIRIKVTVSVVGQTRVELWMRKQSVALETIVPERVPSIMAATNQ